MNQNVNLSELDITQFSTCSEIFFFATAIILFKKLEWQFLNGEQLQSGRMSDFLIKTFILLIH